MIYSVKCNKPSFNTIEFSPGFNIVLAERTKEATRRDSRNGLGKSTLIEIIHFCLGANKGETLRKQQMDDWEFTLELDLAGKRYSVTRSTSETNKIIIEGDSSDWVVPPDVDTSTGKQVISSRDWTKSLGTLMFGLQPVYSDYKYTPTFRSLISYFIRKNGQSGGFLIPFEQHKKQMEWDKQVNNAFLLGLGWEYASKWQVLKDRKKVIEQIRQEAQSGLLPNLLGSTGELEATRIRLQSIVKQQTEQLENFKVHPQYSRIETDANNITKQIHEHVNLNVSDKLLLEQYEESLNEEEDATPDRVKRLYQEAGLVFPDTVKKRMEDVLSFHKKVVANRKDFLSAEIERLRGDIARRESDIQVLTERRSELMTILQTHGALDEFTHLHTNHQDIVAELKNVSVKLENMRKFEQGQSALTIEQGLLKQGANNDLRERSTQKELAVLTFNDNSNYLYEAPGTLSIDVAKTGYKYNVKIERSGSQGIGNMKIFCYDLMLAKIWANREKAPGLLIHDSIIFDGVDERQIALALQLAAKQSVQEGFQYICTMNSDNVPRDDFDEDFNFDDHVVLTLTDVRPEGSLLGVRF